MPVILLSCTAKKAEINGDEKLWDAVSEALAQKDTSRNGVPELAFLASVLRGYACLALLANKLAYFVQFLKENSPTPSDLILGHSLLSGTYFCRTIALNRAMSVSACKITVTITVSMKQSFREAFLAQLAKKFPTVFITVFKGAQHRNLSQAS